MQVFKYIAGCLLPSCVCFAYHQTTVFPRFCASLETQSFFSEEWNQAEMKRIIHPRAFSPCQQKYSFLLRPSQVQDCTRCQGADMLLGVGSRGTRRKFSDPFCSPPLLGSPKVVSAVSGPRTHLFVHHMLLRCQDSLNYSLHTSLPFTSALPHPLAQQPPCATTTPCSNSTFFCLKTLPNNYVLVKAVKHCCLLHKGEGAPPPLRLRWAAFCGPPQPARFALDIRCKRQ